MTYTNGNKSVNGYLRPRPNKDNIRYYDVIVEFGRDEVTKQRKRSTFKAYSKEEAENLLTIKKAEYLKGELLEPSKMTLKQCLDEYMEMYVLPQLSPSTYRDYEMVIKNYLNPELGKIELQRLEAKHIQQMYNKMKVKSPFKDKPLSAATIHHINRCLKSALNYACEAEYIKKNPTKNVKIGKDLSTNRLEVFTVEEVQTLQKKVKGTDMELAIALLFDCVLRRGELLGLCFSDIDFETNTITIQNTWVESADSKNPVLKDCKTDSSYRKMVVSEYTMKLLKRQKIKYKENKMKYGKTFTDSKRVVCKENGEPFLPKSFTRKWARTLEIHEMRHIKLHGTRHSAISMMLGWGLPLHMVQQRAGHQDPSITLSVYSHIAKDNANLVADKLGESLFSAVNA